MPQAQAIPASAPALKITSHRTLYAITDDLQALDEMLIELGGDISDPKVAEAIDAWMAELDRDLTRKADGYASLIKEIEARAKARTEEAKRLTDRARVDENAAAALKSRMLYAMQARQMKTIETARFKLSVTGNGGKTPMVVTDEKAIPEKFHRVVVMVDTDKLRDALEAGQTVPGASLAPRGFHLRIR